MKRLALIVCVVSLFISAAMCVDVRADSPSKASPMDNGANIDVVLLIDRSGSMSASDPENLRMLAAEFFVCLARLGDRVGVVGFDDWLGPVEPLRLLASQADRDVLVDAIRQCTARRYTDISLALREGYNQLSQSPTSNPKGVILLTDGRQTASPYGDEANLYRDRGWKIYTIGWGENVDVTFLQSISDLTGGLYFSGFSCSALREIYRDMAGYEPRAPECDSLCQQFEDWKPPKVRGRICGIVYQDKDQDGVLDPDEGGLSNIGVRIFSGAWSAFVETAWNGSYEFPGLDAGQYDVEIVLPEGYVGTGPTRIEGIPIELTHPNKIGVDFGLTAMPEEPETSLPLPVTGAELATLAYMRPSPTAAGILPVLPQCLPPGANVARVQLPSGRIVLRVFMRGYPVGEYIPGEGDGAPTCLRALYFHRDVR